MLRTKVPPKPREQTKDNERWAGHITFLTITSALAAALIAAFGVIFADPDKITSDTCAKVLILLAAFFSIVTLGCALWASAKLSDYLIWSDHTSVAERHPMAKRITRFAGGAFVAFCQFGLSFLIFVSRGVLCGP
jgi:hypothetical protein